MDSLLLSLVLFLFYCTISSAELLFSIDCGATKNYTDENNIDWIPDAPYVDNGMIYTVKAPDSISEPLKTLRAFTTRKKNCYGVPVKSGGPILVRASFYYQNYDGKASPPTFELQLDGNKWTTVETRMDEEVTYEIIYAVDDGTYICVAQSIDGNIPFVSAIQVSQLDVGMYSDSNSLMAGLLLHRRVAFGSAKAIRYPADEYDRIWEPSISSDSLSVFYTNTTPNTFNLMDPPAPVLQTLVTPSELSTSLSIPLSTNLPSNSAYVYFNLYFNDMLNNDILTIRSFDVYMDGESVTDTISLTSGQVLDFYMSNFTASGMNKFELKATADSALSPIISAMEVFSVTEELNNSTDSSDLDGIATLVAKFDDLNYWGGDPCLPKSYNWDWVECNSENPPRITAIHLGGYGLTGELPDFSNLTALETIDMQNNSINGGIPKFLGELPNLKKLNLASNNLSGPVPSTIADNSNIKLVIDGNPNVCQSGQSCQTFSTDSPPNSPDSTSSPDDSTNSPTTIAQNNKKANKKKGANLGLILGLPIPLAVIALVAVLVTYFLRTRKSPTAAPSVGPGPANQQNTHVNGKKNGGKDSKEENLEEVVVEVGEETVEEVVEEAQEERDVHNV